MLGDVVCSNNFAVLVLIPVVAKFNEHNGGGKDCGPSGDTAAAVTYKHTKEGDGPKSSSPTDTVGLATRRPECFGRRGVSRGKEAVADVPRTRESCMSLSTAAKSLTVACAPGRETAGAAIRAWAANAVDTVR